jgi:hypothetical protein
MDLDAFVSEPINLTWGRGYRGVMVDARQLISDYNNWCQGAFALDANGRPVRPCDMRAVKWSMMGAIGRVSNPFGIISGRILQYINAYLTYRFPDQEFGCAGEFNDYVHHDCVLSFMDEVITNLPMV